jgi:hypothetical protein
MRRISVMVGAMLGISSSVCCCVDLRISFSMFLGAQAWQDDILHAMRTCGGELFGVQRRLKL